jgi:ligand-binding SRPBCC domain-containing protein
MFRLRRHIDIPAPVQEVFEFHLDVRNLLKVSPSFIPVTLVSIPTRPILGAHIDLRARLGPMWFDWRFEISELRKNERFTVRQVRGPFGFWEHVHGFEPTRNGTRLTDTIR